MNTPSNPPNRCPHCEREVRPQSEALFGQMPCPTCGKELWYLSAASEGKFFDFESSAEIQQKTYTFIAERLEVDRDELIANPQKIADELNVDSLEALEMLMDLEDELGIAS